MAVSPLVTKWVGCSGAVYTQGRPYISGDGYPTGKVLGIVIHHQAGTDINVMDNMFVSGSRGGSAHYGVSGKEIHGYVDESCTAWHCGIWWGNVHTIGIEVSNSAVGGDYPVSEESFNTLVKLVADIAKRNGLPKLYINPPEDCAPITGHRDWYATNCPGNYLYARLQELCDKANAINYPPKPTVTWVDTPVTTMRVKAGGTNLVNVVTGTVVKGLSAGEEFTYVQKTSDDKYVRTEYSKEHNVNNGVLLSALEPIPAPEPEPTPEPGPTPEPTPEPDPGEDVPNWFVKFIKDLINFLFGWIGKGKDK